MKRAITMFIGCDLGDKKTTICVLDEDGQIAERAQIPTTKGGFERFFAKRDRARGTRGGRSLPLDELAPHRAGA